jgi:hypothetical protein
MEELTHRAPASRLLDQLLDHYEELEKLDGADFA